MRKTTITLLFCLLTVLGLGQMKNFILENTLPDPVGLVAPGDGYNIENEFIGLTWNYNGEVLPDGYKVYLDENNPPATLLYDGIDTYYQFINVEQNKVYYWKVVPYNAEGEAQNPEVWSFTTFELTNIWEEDFSDMEPDWTVVNHSGADNEWEFDGMRASVYTPWEWVKDNTPVWSTMTSSLIDCSGYENIRLYVNQDFYNEDEYENYYALIEISIDDETWHEVAVFDGDLINYTKFWGLPYYQFNISDLVDGSDQFRVRFEFNSNGDWDLGWDIDKVGLIGELSEGSLVPAPLSYTSPGNGSNSHTYNNISWSFQDGPQPDGLRVYIDESYPPETLVFEADSLFFLYYYPFEVNKEYFWKVVPFNSAGDAEDVEIWSFTTYYLNSFWSEDFVVQDDDYPDWEIENLSGASNQWEFPGTVAIISNVSEPDGAQVWSTLTSPAINCIGQENIHLYGRFRFTHNLDEFDNYYLRILISTNGNDWVVLKDYDGEMMGGLPYPTWRHPFVNISDYADNQPEVFIRFEFNSNGDLDLTWFWPEIELLSSTIAPEAAILLSPEDGTFDVPADIVLEWERGDGGMPVGYRLYLDQVNPPQTLLADGNFTSYSELELDSETQYFWKVVPYNYVGEPEEITVWSFTTGEFTMAAPENAMILFPEDGAINISLDATLMWAPGDGTAPDGYRIYFDTSYPPQTLVDNGDFQSFTPQGLEHNTVYFWKVVPYNEGGEPGNTPVWSFTTKVDETTSVDLIMEQGMVVFPNPANQKVSVVADAMITGVRMFDIKGRLVYATSCNDESLQIDISDLDSGIYVLQVQTLNGLRMQRIQVVK
jgi:hypothetical protein